MLSRRQLVVVLLILSGGLSLCRADDTGRPSSDTIEFDRDIRPILADHCFQCHGPDAATREAGLRLDQSSAATAKLDSGEFAIVPGDSASSEMIRRITEEDTDLRMPPPEVDSAVSAAELAMLRRWIDAGAVFTQHWAFVPPTRSEWLVADRHPIDQFIERKWDEQGLQPTPLASKETIIRRLSFDLRGLPPTLDEIDRYLADTADGAYERLVDEFLSSPHYGERMAAMWLDGARYADTNGYQNDFNRSMWPYRDWVIERFNENQPFDQFTIEQLAGDLLPSPTLAQKVATGFNRNHRTVTEAGSLEEEWLVENVIDRIETTGTVYLGLTIGCARCHDHKFDPISQREFYQFFDFFHQVDEKGVYTEQRGNVEPLVTITDEEQAQQLAAWIQEGRQLKDQAVALQAQVDEAYERWLSGDPQDPVSPPDSPSMLIPLDGSLQATSAKRPEGFPLEVGAAPATETSFLGPSRVFDGGQWFDCGDDFAPEYDRPFTISVWMRPDVTGAVISKIDRPEADDSFKGFDVLAYAAYLSVHLIHDWPENALKVVTTEPLSKDTISHVAVTYDGSHTASGLKIYVNGLLRATKVEKDNLTASIANSVPLQVGRRSSGDFYSGSAQDIRCFERELSEAEVHALIADKLTALVRVQPAETADNAALTWFRDVLKNAYVGLGLDPSSQGLTEVIRQQREIAARQAELQETVPSTMVMQERETPRETYVLMRGRYDMPDTDRKVTADVPACLPPLGSDQPRNRLGLARWLVSRENPLTARVFANRLWEQFFGVGIVKSSENFGFRSDLPSHRELLDWLAVEFMESSWDVKGLVRRIVTSDAYRRSSLASAADYQHDPENRWLSRGPRFRLPAEAVRDNALAVSGLLSAKIGGPSVKPYQPDGLWEELAGGANGGPYEVAEGEDLYRRSLYTFRKRTVPHPTLSTFDAPSWEICQVHRATTNTPLQALALWNDTTYLEAARELAERILLEGGSDDVTRLTYAFRRCTGRLPTSIEMQRLSAGLQRFRASFKDEATAHQFVSHGRSPADEQLDVRELAAHTAMASALLNLDETITKE